MTELWEQMGTPSRLGITIGKEFMGKPYRPFPWLLHVESRILDAITDPNERFLIVNIPPQMGKSTFSCMLLPAWYLGMYPHHQVILVGYSETYAESWGLKTRNLLDRYGQRLFGVGVSKQSAAGANWKTSQGFGGMLSVGIGGGITGNPGNCFPGDTLVSTPMGPIDIATLASNGGIVWGYDHTTGSVVPRPVIAGGATGDRQIVEIEFDSGRVLRCTTDHPIYIEGRGYEQAGLVESGAQVRTLRDDALHAMRKASDVGRGRARQEDAAGWEHLLRPPVRGGVPPSKGHAVCSLRGGPRSDGQGDQTEGDLLFAAVPAGSQCGETPRVDLPGMWDGVPAEEFQADVLLQAVRELGALEADARRGELALQDRAVIHETIQRHPAAHPREGRGPLRRLRDALHPTERTPSASHRRGPAEQRARESGDALSGLPYGPPQVEADTVSVVRRLRGGGVPVYDIQVEDTSNFFAEGILVHNCIIIDDVLKTMEEAASITTKKKHLAEYDGAISSRFQERDGDQPGTTVLITATRFADDDLSGSLIERMDKAGYAGDKWEVISIPALAEPPDDLELSEEELAEWTDFLGRHYGEATRGRYSKRFFEQKRASIDPYTWSALYQQQPSVSQGGMFPKENWQFWNDSNLPQIVRCVRAWDLAATEGAGDWTVGSLMGIGVNGDLYVLDRQRFRKNSAAVEDAVKQTAQLDGHETKILIEQEKAGAGKSQVEHYQRLLAGYFVEPAKIDGSKEVRATPYSAMQQRRRVWLPERDELLCKEWIAEHARMMGDGRRPRHDDQIDTGAYCVLELIGQGESDMWIPGEDPDDLASAIFAEHAQMGRFNPQGMPEWVQAFG